MWKHQLGDCPQLHLSEREPLSKSHFTYAFHRTSSTIQSTQTLESLHERSLKTACCALRNLVLAAFAVDS